MVQMSGQENCGACPGGLDWIVIIIPGGLDWHNCYPRQIGATTGALVKRTVAFVQYQVDWIVITGGLAQTRVHCNNT